MVLSDPELEELEKEYFNQIFYQITHDKQRMKYGLMSRDKIKSDWYATFMNASTSQTSDLARGAERVFFWLLSNTWTPNSSPIGSDLFFESYNAFIHIDIKTARENNTSDFKGLVPVGKNQTCYNPTHSHSGTRINTTANLPDYYNNGKPCLTYYIQIIYDHTTFENIAILLICVPNGQLFGVYGNDIINAGKNKDESFRYKYSRNPYFSSLGRRYVRAKFIYYNNSYGLTKIDIADHSRIR